MRKVNLFCVQGEDFAHQIPLLNSAGNPYDISQVANTAAQIRKSYISANAVTLTTNLNVSSVLSLSLHANQTSQMVPGRYIYDVNVTDSANLVSKPIGGIFTIEPGASR